MISTVSSFPLHLSFSPKSQRTSKTMRNRIDRKKEDFRIYASWLNFYVFVFMRCFLIPLSSRLLLSIDFLRAASLVWCVQKYSMRRKKFSESKWRDIFVVKRGFYEWNRKKSFHRTQSAVMLLVLIHFNWWLWIKGE